MKTLGFSSKGRRFVDASEALLLLLLVISLTQIVCCLDAGRVVLHSRFAYDVSDPVARLTTNAPMVGDRHLPPMQKSAGFPSGATRG
jgi:hypothetical protein